MATLNRKKQLQKRLDPLEILSLSLRTHLTEHQESFTPEELNLLTGKIRSKDWNFLLLWGKKESSLSPPPLVEHEAFAVYLARRQFVAFFKKFEFTPEESGLDPDEAARTTFLTSEKRCLRTNKKLRLLTRGSMERRKSDIGPAELGPLLSFLSKGDQTHESRLKLYQYLDGCRRWIKSVLGATPDMTEIYNACDFGGGASLGVHGKATNIARKFFASEWTCTPNCASHGFEAIMANHHLRSLLFPVGEDLQTLVPDQFYRWTFKSKLRLVDYNKLEFVPKNAFTHRVIATEPLINGFVQKGIEKVLRKLLKAVGIDIKFGWESNQHWAKLGSMHQGPFGLCTIDLSAASDSICIQLVKFLLPTAWFALLNDVRSPGYRTATDDGKTSETKRYEKFCSMGNGFCFPLETLIFAAFARQACKEAQAPTRYLVFGDDIIVQQQVVEPLRSRLEFVGFRINLDKSFVSGTFRESCGADWVEGRMVTPVYMRKRIDTKKKLVDFHNSLQNSCFGEPFRNNGVAKALRSTIPIDKRYVELWRPSCKPINTGFLVEQDEFIASPLVRWDRDTYSWLAPGYVTQGVPDEKIFPLHNAIQYVAVLRGASSTEPLTLRRETRTRVDHFTGRRAHDIEMMIKSRMYLPLN